MFIAYKDSLTAMINGFFNTVYYIGGGGGAKITNYIYSQQWLAKTPRVLNPNPSHLCLQIKLTNSIMLILDFQNKVKEKRPGFFARLFGKSKE